jgi:hypothetical protein
MRRDGHPLLVYLDTMLWNDLLDQRVDPENLLPSLEAVGVQLVLGTGVVYELAKTFQMASPAGMERGRSLFSCLRGFLRPSLRCLRETKDILIEEAKYASKQSSLMHIWLSASDRIRLDEEVDKLSRGVFDARADIFVANRKAEAQQERNDIAGHFAGGPQLSARLAAVPTADLEGWIRNEFRISGRRLLRPHITRMRPDLPPGEVTWLARRMLARPIFRVSHAIIRGDLYANWRCAQGGSIPRDMPDDLYHVVNAAHCDAYATRERAQAKYAHFVLTKTSVRLYDGLAPLTAWLAALSGDTS